MEPTDDPKGDLSSADRTAGREGEALEDPRKGGSRIQTYTWILITAAQVRDQENRVRYRGS